MFAPLAFNQILRDGGCCGACVTLISVLMGYLIAVGFRTTQQPDQPRAHRAVSAATRPAARVPQDCVGGGTPDPARDGVSATHIAGEFLPPLDEGDLLYMPSALPGISAGKVAELLQQLNRLIKTVPEVASVFGKAGRADTATDPAPLECSKRRSVQAAESVAPGNDARQAGSRVGPDRQSARLDQRLGATDSQSHRHAGDWNQDSRGRQGGGYKLARD